MAQIPAIQRLGSQGALRARLWYPLLSIFPFHAIASYVPAFAFAPLSACPSTPGLAFQLECYGVNSDMTFSRSELSDPRRTIQIRATVLLQCKCCYVCKQCTS